LAYHMPLIVMGFASDKIDIFEFPGNFVRAISHDQSL